MADFTSIDNRQSKFDRSILINNNIPEELYVESMGFLLNEIIDCPTTTFLTDNVFEEWLDNNDEEFIRDFCKQALEEFKKKKNILDK